MKFLLYFQYSSSVPVLLYLQAVLFLKNLNIFHEYLMQQSLKLGGTNYHFKWVKYLVPSFIERPELPVMDI